MSILCVRKASCTNPIPTSYYCPFLVKVKSFPFNECGDPTAGCKRSDEIVRL